MKLSIVINCDTRPENNTFGGSNLMGVVNEDFLIDGLINKQKFFYGFEIETIIHVDKHNDVHPYVLDVLQERSDVLVVRKHTDEHLFNDNNYIRALSLATGDIIIHIDQDTAMFASSKEEVQTLIDNLNQYDFISYPSHCSPLPVHDSSFDHVWCSTRFFMCKRESLDLPEITKCLNDYDYWCETYPVNRKCHWLEHLIGSIAKYRNQSVFYPSIGLNSFAIFSWGSYKKGTLQMLNNMPYEEVKRWIEERGIHYPVDINI